MPFSVITSGKAKEDYLNIKNSHADILMGMANQKVRVDQLNQARDQARQTEEQNLRVMQNELKKQEMVTGVTREKNVMDYNLKNAELDIKRAALAQT